MATDKSKWPDGPWKTEPDEERWADEETGLHCAIFRNGIGSLCGYVGIPESHPLHGMDCDKCHDLHDISVHGGLTFSDVIVDSPEGLHWLGFDCAHYGDYSPTYPSEFSTCGKSQYRNIDYVRNECRSLAKRLSVIGAEK